MAKVKVYRARLYDVSNDDWTRSRRWFTRLGAEKFRAELDEATEIEIDESDLEEPWYTARDYRPNTLRGLQTQVTV